MTGNSISRKSCVRRMVWRWLAGAALFVGVAGSLGATCNPTPPVCGATACQSNEVRTCLDKCVVPVALGGSCSKDPCASNGVCASDAVCTDGTCQNPNRGLAVECNPDLPNQCSNSTICRRGSCSGADISRCGLPISHGNACDSNFEAWPPQCRPCEPGTKCVGGFCHKPCQTDADCPCGKGLSCAPSKHCYPCKKAGDTGCGGESPCCDGSTCAQARCCFSNGHACTNKGECCGTSVCIGGACAACTAAGGACTTDAQCCGNATCKAGVCSVPCTAGGACTVSGAKGECKYGKTECSPTGSTCKQVISPTPETCDGKDNDCDGTVDDDVVFSPADCSTTPAGCQAGFSAKGKQKCQSGKAVCVAEVNVDYCNACGSIACGACGATPCTPGVTKCTPGYVCKKGATIGCGISDESTTCWPIDGAHCSGCAGMACWTPAQVTVGGACP